jgi:hypothetical protein
MRATVDTPIESPARAIRTRYHCAEHACPQGGAPPHPRRGRQMRNVYVEPRPKGLREGSPIDDYVVEDHSGRLLGTFKTLRDAIQWAKKQDYRPLVAQVRHLNLRNAPEHWRAG